MRAPKEETKIVSVYQKLSFSSGFIALNDFQEWRLNSLNNSVMSNFFPNFTFGQFMMSFYLTHGGITHFCYT